MKTILLAFLAVSTLSFGQNYDSWKTYVSEDGHLSIGFPYDATLSLEGEDDESVTTYKYQLERSDYIYIASVSIHETDLSETDEELCQVSLDSFNEAIKGKLINQKVWKVQGQIGITATIRLQESISLCYRVVIKDNLQYQLVIMNVNGNLPAEKANEFFNTFRMTE